MDLVFTVGQYTQVSMMLNAFGVQLEAGETVGLIEAMRLPYRRASPRPAVLASRIESAE